MCPSYDDFEDFAFDEIDAMRRRARNRELAQMRVNSRQHYSPDNDEFDDDKWAEFDAEYGDYDENEWDTHAE